MYCAENLDAPGVNYDNAPLIGSATGHCFLSPVQIVDGHGGESNGCDQTGPCEWSCQEVMIIENNSRDDYLFLQYIYKPARAEDVTSLDYVYVGDFPDLFDVVVTGGT
jgi:hypothetical protein